MIPVNIILLLLSTYLEAAVVRHRFSVSYFSGAPDGVIQPKILGINGQFPCPTIRANVGDTLEITLVNDIQDGQSTTLHWHGIHQMGSIFEDGASQVTQCPVPPGGTQIYRFKVHVAGTYWYHSHVRSQYTEGLFGALIVDPETKPHDDEFTITLSDWYHQSAHENEAWYLAPGKHSAPYPNSGLINGLGRYPCDIAEKENRVCIPSLQYRPVFTVMHGLTYRIRIANSAAFASFKFSLDGHRLKVIEVDGIAVAKPPTVDILSIAPGQRYSVLVTPRKAGRFLIRTPIIKEHMRLLPDNINKNPEALIGDLTAVLNVAHVELSDEQYMVAESKEKFQHDEIVPKPTYNIQNLVALDVMTLSPLDGIAAPDPVTKEFMIYTSVVTDDQNIPRATFNEKVFHLPEKKPMLLSFLGDGLLPKNSIVLEVVFGDVVQLVLDNPQQEPHPFHLHGHHFWVMGLGKKGDGKYQSGRHKLTRKGPKRDTVVVQEDSWMVIRFVADNPGIWLFHCHIDWHNLAGMALVFVEAGDRLRKGVQVSNEARKICGLHGIKV